MLLRHDIDILLDDDDVVTGVGGRNDSTPPKAIESISATASDVLADLLIFEYTSCRCWVKLQLFCSNRIEGKVS